MPENFADYLQRRLKSIVTEAVLTLEEIHSVSGHTQISAENCLVMIRDEVELRLEMERGDLPWRSLEE